MIEDSHIPVKASKSQIGKLSSAELARLEELEKAARPAPWGVTKWSGGFCFDGKKRLYAGNWEGEPNPIREDQFEFIAEARNAFPSLLALAREHEQVIAAETSAYDAIFYAVPEANDDSGKPLSVADKIKRLVGEHERVMELVQWLFENCRINGCCECYSESNKHSEGCKRQELTALVGKETKQ